MSMHKLINTVWAAVTHGAVLGLSHSAAPIMILGRAQAGLTQPEGRGYLDGHWPQSPSLAS